MAEALWVLIFLYITSMKGKKYSVYVHRTPDGMYYAGMTNNVKDRWYPSCYVETSLFPYINKYGWENIEHVVVVGGLDYNTAKKT